MAMQTDDQLRKGPWLEEEDQRLIDFVSVFGQRRWDALAKASGLRRSGKSCRLRWMNYLRPNLKHGHITQEEELLIIQLHKQWGNRWSRIARKLPGRTDNEIKNYWRSQLRKKALTLEQESVNEAVSPCLSNEEWNSAGKWDHLGISDKSCNEFDLSEFELSCTSPYETRLTDWISNWSGKDPNETEENINCCKAELFYSPMELTSGYSDSDTVIWDTSFSIWDLNYK